VGKDLKIGGKTHDGLLTGRGNQVFLPAIFGIGLLFATFVFAIRKK
jgi:hypothetical protein